MITAARLSSISFSPKGQSHKHTYSHIESHIQHSLSPGRMYHSDVKTKQSDYGI